MLLCVSFGVGLITTVCCRFVGPLPSVIFVRGVTPSGQLYNFQIPVYITRDVPVAKLFAKRQLELMCSRHWLMMEGSPEADSLIHEIRAVSVATEVPCIHTQMVGFQTTTEDIQKRRSQAPAERTQKTKNKKGMTASKVALGAAGAIALGATVAAGVAIGSAALGDAALGGGLGGGFFDVCTAHI